MRRMKETTFEYFRIRAQILDSEIKLGKIFVHARLLKISSDAVYIYTELCIMYTKIEQLNGIENRIFSFSLHRNQIQYNKL